MHQTPTENSSVEEVASFLETWEDGLLKGKKAYTGKTLINSSRETLVLIYGNEGALLYDLLHPSRIKTLLKPLISYRPRSKEIGYDKTPPSCSWKGL
jgi:hypothetical protein